MIPRALRVLIAVLIAGLAVVLFGTTASASPAVGAETRVGAHQQNLILSVRVEDSAAQTSTGVCGPPLHPLVPATGVVAETAGTALDASELGAGQASNYARYVKKLPSGARDPVITRGSDGAVQFSADVPGRVPGSYATYTKIVDSSGTTTDYFKTTVAPDGSIAHVKIKFP